MPTTAVYLTQVHFRQTVSVFLKDSPGLCHCGIDLPGMSDIEAQASFGKSSEKLTQFLCRSTDRLALIHVFDQQAVVECCPALEGVRWRQDE